MNNNYLFKNVCLNQFTYWGPFRTRESWQSRISILSLSSSKTLNNTHTVSKKKRKKQEFSICHPHGLSWECTGKFIRRDLLRLMFIRSVHCKSQQDCMEGGKKPRLSFIFTRAMCISVWLADQSEHGSDQTSLLMVTFTRNLRKEHALWGFKCIYEIIMIEKKMVPFAYLNWF